MPVNNDQEALVAAWCRAKDRLVEAKAIIDEEMRLRRLVAATVFPAAKEGTNKEALPNDWTLKYVHSIERKILRDVLPSISEGLRTNFNVNPDALIRNTPELIVKPYRELSDEARHFFDQALNIYPGTPSLELVPPKEKK